MDPQGDSDTVIILDCSKLTNKTKHQALFVLILFVLGRLSNYDTFKYLAHKFMSFYHVRVI